MQGAQWNSEEEYYYIVFERKYYRLIFDEETNKWTVPRRSTRTTAPSPATTITRRFSAQEPESEEGSEEQTKSDNADQNSNPDVDMSGTMTVTSQTTTQPQQGESGGGSGGGAPPPPPPNPPAGGGPNLPGGGGPNPPGGPGGFAGIAAAPAAHPMGEIGINRPQPFDGNVDDLETFVTSCRVYFTMNGHIYDTDMKKIMFFLSYCTKGRAAVFTSHFLDT